MGTYSGRYRCSLPHLRPGHQKKVSICLFKSENLLGGPRIYHPFRFYYIGVDYFHKVRSAIWMAPCNVQSLAHPGGHCSYFAFGTALYTGILLKATKSIPLWNTYFLPLLFLVSALSTGSMAIILSTLGSGLFTHDSTALKVLMSAEQILVVVEGIVLYIYLSRSYRTSEQGKDSIRLLLLGEKKFIFWGGIVLLGFIFPFVLEGIGVFSRGNVWLIFSSGVVLLCGGFFLRLGVLSAGIKEQIPMQRWTEFQYDLRGPE
jgi:uncharacterized membrane protein